MPAIDPKVVVDVRIFKLGGFGSGWFSRSPESRGDEPVWPAGPLPHEPARRTMTGSARPYRLSMVAHSGISGAAALASASPAWDSDR